jgi:hypothetical protein
VLHPNGRLVVEVLDGSGKGSGSSGSGGSALPLCGYDWDSAGHVVGPVDSIRLKVPLWRNGAAIAALAGRRVRLRFHLVSGTLYSFWVSHTQNGSSGGYLGGGAFGSRSIVDE